MKPDPKIIKESLEAYDRGDYLTTEELLYEIKSRRQKKRRVRKKGGSFQHTGVVVAEFETTAGAKRIVLEFDPPVDGMLHIYRPDQVEDIDEG